MEKIVEKYVDLPKSVRIPLWQLWHNLILIWDPKSKNLRFMNYGYAPLEGNAEMIALKPEDRAERYGAQLYHTAVADAQIEGKDVLEVSSGRGGGASYISRYLKPRSYIGLDLSKRSIRYCNRVYRRIPNLRFVQGDAENLPLGDSSVDRVVNVEASRAYPHQDRFFAEVRRVLRPDGLFCLTDMRWAEDVPRLMDLLRRAGFDVVRELRISDNVVRALQADNERKVQLMRSRVPKVFIRAFSEFAGMEGSERYESFASGRMQYLSLVLKPRK